MESKKEVWRLQVFLRFILVLEETLILLLSDQLRTTDLADVTLCVTIIRIRLRIVEAPNQSYHLHHITPRITTTHATESGRREQEQESDHLLGCFCLSQMNQLIHFLKTAILRGTFPLRRLIVD